MLREYEITYTDGVWYMIARSDELAAYAAKEFETNNKKLLNVRRSDEW